MSTNNAEFRKTISTMVECFCEARRIKEIVESEHIFHHSGWLTIGTYADKRRMHGYMDIWPINQFPKIHAGRTEHVQQAADCWEGMSEDVRSFLEQALTLREAESEVLILKERISQLELRNLKAGMWTSKIYPEPKYHTPAKDTTDEWNTLNDQYTEARRKMNMCYHRMEELMSKYTTHSIWSNMDDVQRIEGK